MPVRWCAKPHSKIHLLFYFLPCYRKRAIGKARVTINPTKKHYRHQKSFNKKRFILIKYLRPKLLTHGYIRSTLSPPYLFWVFLTSRNPHAEEGSGTGLGAGCGIRSRLVGTRDPPTDQCTYDKDIQTSKAKH